MNIFDYHLSIVSAKISEMCQVLGLGKPEAVLFLDENYNKSVKIKVVFSRDTQAVVEVVDDRFGVDGMDLKDIAELLVKHLPPIDRKVRMAEYSKVLGSFK
jgi:hypothetical protein